jgi:hypothetical protein
MLRVMLDSRAIGNFINKKVVVEEGFKVRQKAKPYHLFLVDSEEIRTNKGIVTYETYSLEMKILKGHTKDI